MNSSPLTAARAAHSAAQAALAQAAAEVARLEAEAKTPGRRLADELVRIVEFEGVDRICIGALGVTDGSHPVVDVRERAEDIRKFLAYAFDSALAERPAAPQPAELPEGMEPAETFVGRAWWGSAARIAKDIAKRDSLHAARTQRAVELEREACAVLLEKYRTPGDSALRDWNEALAEGAQMIRARKDAPACGS